MRWPWRPRRAARSSNEAQEAQERAKDALSEAHSRWERIRPTTDYLKAAGRRNHFSEAILAAFRGTEP
jgi:hypothetical protein